METNDWWETRTKETDDKQTKSMKVKLTEHSCDHSKLIHPDKQQCKLHR